MNKLIGFLVFFLLVMSTNINAQSWRDLFKSPNSGSTAVGVNNKDFIGRWTYTGSAIEFESADFLKKAGGKAGAAQIKTKLDEQLAKFGVKPELVDFVFSDDNTFTCLMNGKYLKGTYLYYPADNKAAVTLAGFLSLEAKVNISNKKMTILFDANKLLIVLGYLGERANNPTFKAIAALASSYDGMLMGLEMKKK